MFTVQCLPSACAQLWLSQVLVPPSLAINNLLTASLGTVLLSLLSLPQSLYGKATKTPYKTKVTPGLTQVLPKSSLFFPNYETSSTLAYLVLQSEALTLVSSPLHFLTHYSVSTKCLNPSSACFQIINHMKT